jgi:putative DNA primase/helicase
MSIDFRVVNAALDPFRVVPEWLPEGKKVGDNWMARNGSLAVNLTTGKWALFSSDEKSDRGGDLVGLYAWIFHNKNQVEAARELMRTHGIVDNAQTREQAAKITPLQQPTYTPVMPVPEDVPQEPNQSWAKGFKHPEFGKPSHVWAYRDSEGRLLMYVARYTDGDGTKQVMPWSWGTHPTKGNVGWQMRGLTGGMKRPLYGLDKLAKYPGHDVLVVEGEKTADAAQELLGEACVVVSWMGGMGAADKADVRRLAQRKVYLWPDFDAHREKLTNEEKAAEVDPRSKPILPLHKQGGALAMMAIATKLKGLTADANIRMVGYQPGEKAHGWDLADALDEGWTGEDVLKMLAERSRDPREVMTADTIKPAAPAEPVAAAPAPAAAAPATPAPKYTPLEYPVNEFDFPDRGDKGPLDTLENLAYLMRQYGIESRYNVISKDVEISIPNTRFSQDNHMEACLATIGSLCARNRMPRANVPGYITTLADGNKVNPAADWIDSKPHDGVSRIDALADTLDAADPELARVLVRRWMIGAVACAFEDHGFSMQGVLVLQGAQGLGKTTWIMRLADNDRNLVAESVILNPADKDSVKQFASYWLVELGELEATFSKSDITALRGFLTKKVDELRLPYAKATSKFPRRTAAAASVNDRAYLRDETGNRRYWTIECGEGFNAMHDIDMQQVWAEAKALYLAGERHPLTKDEMERLSESNMTYTERNPLSDLIMDRFDWESLSVVKMSATDVCIAVGYDKPTTKQVKDAGTILRKATGKEPSRSNGRVVFAVPPLKRNSYKQEQNFEDDNSRPF